MCLLLRSVFASQCRTCERRCFPLNCTISRETPPENHANSCILSVGCLPAHVDSRAHFNWRTQRICVQQNLLSSPHQTDVQHSTMIAFVRGKSKKQRTIWTERKTPLENSSSARFELEKSNSWRFFLTFFRLCLLFHFLHFSLIDKVNRKKSSGNSTIWPATERKFNKSTNDFSKLVILWKRYFRKPWRWTNGNAEGRKRPYVRASERDDERY